MNTDREDHATGAWAGPGTYAEEDAAAFRAAVDALPAGLPEDSRGARGPRGRTGERADDRRVVTTG
ncbi:hypothetical protein ABZ690_16555 [Streptomyces sp. NPDC006967]|uniref:hypothetical protein n=1 Tax=unclassified Streptomyces TaxID=2593676 RepID=UPI000CD4F790|nr:hypothetical protein [Streptomyces sp. SM1]